jgi:hypothetical protein
MAQMLQIYNKMASQAEMLQIDNITAPMDLMLQIHNKSAPGVQAPGFRGEPF